MKKSKYELLAPAGDFSMLSAAVKAGADSVYFGLQEFNMRAGAKNFKFSDLPKIREICNSSSRKVKMYLTLNTIIYSDELKKLEELIKKVKGKVDAVICWDLSVIELCKKYKIPFHISTQASISNSSSVEFYKKLGAERIVLARELNLEQIKEIIKKVNIEVETFIHGAMCVSESGRCFTSQFLFNKSANRGECLQPCRRTYFIKDLEGNELNLECNKVLSAKDLCTLPFIEKLKSAGIKYFKIEGRTRDARYVDVVVRAYRQALDKKLTKQEIEKSLNKLKTVYNRGFSSGFYLGLPTPDDFAKIEHSAATEKKVFVGKVKHYYDKIGVAVVKVSFEFKVGDEVVIIGEKTGSIRTKIESMEINHKKVEVAKKGDEVGVKFVVHECSPNAVASHKGQEVGVKTPFIRKNDELYLIKK